jgi:hypothetical protein|nr:MAG TPA: hypothetical protein [Caudoviricetes sp.]
MVKVYRDPHIVWNDRYYIWTYIPEKYKGSRQKNIVSEKYLYPKWVTPIPYLSRVHAKHVIVFSYNRKALKHIHIIYGKKLIKQGITYLNYNKKTYNMMYYKGRKVHVKKWVYPPEAKMDTHRRRKYIVKLNRAVKRLSKKDFNHFYKTEHYGYNFSGLSRYYLRRRYREYKMALVQEILTPEQARKIRFR